MQRHDAGGGADLFGCPPGAGKDLVRPRAEQKRGRAAVDLVDMVPGFGIEKWNGPSAALESAPAVLVRPAESLHHSVDRDVRGDRQFHDRRSYLVWFCPFGAPPLGALSPLLRTPLPRSHTASRLSFEDFLVRRL